MCIREGEENRWLAQEDINRPCGTFKPCTLWEERRNCLYQEIPLSDLILYTHWKQKDEEFFKLLEK
jgi:hypothetical protein